MSIRVLFICHGKVLTKWPRTLILQHFSNKRCWIYNSFTTFAEAVFEASKESEKGFQYTMISILFVCWGNICRSPMCEYMMKDLVKRKGIADEFYIESAATSTEEIGNGVYPPAKRKLASVGISCNEKRARQLTKADYSKFDYIIGMEDLNMRYMLRILGGDPDGKLYNLLDFTDHPRAIADPWYTGDFDQTYDDIVEGLDGFLNFLHIQ